MTAGLDAVADGPSGEAAVQSLSDTVRSVSATAIEDVGDGRSVSVCRRNAPWYLTPFGYLPPAASGGPGAGAWWQP